jgi:hypothetical protein
MKTNGFENAISVSEGPIIWGDNGIMLLVELTIMNKKPRHITYL